MPISALLAISKAAELSDGTSLVLATAGLGVVGALIGVLTAARWSQRRCDRRWQGAVAELLEKIRVVRAGEAATEELNGLAASPLAPLVTPVQELMRDLKSQRAEVAALEAETRQRVANRTDALERALSSLRYQATRDPLTGLFNRRFLDQYLPQAIERHVHDHTDFCVLMIDVDNFKVLNDTLGHAAGDELLRSIGQIIRSTTRGEDVSFRCGGDEFVVLLPGCGQAAGKVMADRLTSLVDGLAKVLRVPALPRLSIGMACLAELNEPTPQALLEQADQALYHIKNERKDARTPRKVIPEPASASESSRRPAAIAGK